ncbi:MAG: response regulator [Pirellulales bacterium]
MLFAHSKGLELACRIDPDVPEFVRGDPSRLRQVIVNLLGNAIKFTDEGEVVVRVDLDRPAQANGKVELQFTVTDTGIGIPDAQLAAVFEAFRQADSSTTRRFGGTGLGLAISSRLVELMGGRIWAESKLGQGSAFHFTSRFGRVDGHVAAPSMPESIEHAPVLIVDDNATNRLILQEMVSCWRMSPWAVSSVDEALESLRAAARRGEPFRLVLTDCNMPARDGFDLATAIRRDGVLAGTAVIMLTSSDRPGDIARCAKLGISAHLIKPAKQSELLGAILGALVVAAPQQGVDDGAPDKEETAEDDSAVGPFNVLLAEDGLVNQRLAVGLLKKHGHSVTVVGNGREALAAVSREPYDLVLMDVEMPELDGLEATQRIRHTEVGTDRHVPIIAMTAHAMKGDRERCLAAGMDDYLSKPIRARDLVEVIENVMRGHGLPHSTSSLD